MKKRSLWILFMTALLCLTMLFAACDSEGDIEETSETNTEAEETESVTNNTTETPTEPETEATPKDEVVDYSALIDEWGKYISVVEPDNGDAFTSSKYMYNVYTQEIDGVLITQNTYGNIVAVTTRYQAVYNTSGEGDPVLETPIRKSTLFFNMSTGAQLLANPVSQADYIHAIQSFQRDYKYTVYFNSIVEITISTYENLGTADEPVWQTEPTVKYSYYDANGTALATDLDERATYHESINCVSIDGKNYYCQNGEIIFVTDDIYPHKLPNFGSEYNGYKYYIDTLSDKIQVVNTETYRLVVDYASPYALDGEYVLTDILSNGDVYIFALEKVDNNSIFFDVEIKDVPNCEDGKYSVHHIIISVSTGKVTEVEADFIPVNMFTKASSELYGMELNGDYQYAEIFRIADGKLVNTLESVILDDKLAEVAKLPNIFKNQYGIEGMSGTKLLVTVKNFATGKETTFVADMLLGTVSQHMQVDQEVREINNGYIIGSKVYNLNFEEVLDLSELNYSIRNGNLYITETITQEVEDTDESAETDTADETETDGEIETVEALAYKVSYIDSDGKLQENVINVDVEPKYDGAGLYQVEINENDFGSDPVSNVKLYNARGELIYTYSDVDSFEILFDGSVVTVRIDNKISYYSIK